MGRFHYLARGIVFDDDKVLLVKLRGQSNTFLPGGHIEYGESASRTIEREFMEELGCKVNVGPFIGALEHLWPESSSDNHEINLLFLVSIDGVENLNGIESQEENLEAYWVPIAELSNVNLQPQPLRKFLELGTFTQAYWGSTINA